MKRAPEPELMDDDAQARAYAEADFAEPHDNFVRYFRERFPGVEPAGTYLDLGCGPADVVARFAQAFPALRIDGIDGSEAMLRYGAKRIEEQGLAGRVRLVHGYLPGARAPEARYDGITSNSLLHHLADPQVLWRALCDFAAPGAPVLIMDLMRPATFAAAHALVEAHTEGAPPILRRDFYHSLLAAYEPEEVRAQLAACALGHFEIEAVSDRHFVVWGRMR
ncbi:MAG: class I SAM-dependent methyltransferase [Planctomycetes bacterium]|nr:class I SAM-dependent methyltransferase [Planctomycetota bacterium]